MNQFHAIIIIHSLNKKERRHYLKIEVTILANELLKDYLKRKFSCYVFSIVLKLKKKKFIRR